MPLKIPSMNFGVYLKAKSRKIALSKQFRVLKRRLGDGGMRLLKMNPPQDGDDRNK